MTESLKYFEDFRAGEVVDLGDVSVSEDEIIAFGRQFDPQPFHVDPEAARSSPYRSLIASGWHTCGLFMRLFVASVLSHAAALGSPGAEEVRWLQPVRPGDLLSGRIEILETRPSGTNPSRGTLLMQGELTNRQGQPVMRLRARVFMARRSPSA